MSTLDHAEDFDLDLDHPLALYRIARFARSHGHKAHVTRAGSVLVVDNDGSIRSVRTMSALVRWMGY